MNLINVNCFGVTNLHTKFHGDWINNSKVTVEQTPIKYSPTYIRPLTLLVSTTMCRIVYILSCCCPLGLVGCLNMLATKKNHWGERKRQPRLVFESRCLTQSRFQVLSCNIYKIKQHMNIICYCLFATFISLCA